MVDNALGTEMERHPYYQARVNVYIIPEGSDDHLVVYLFRSDIYYAPCFRLEVENMQVTEVVEDYVEEQPDDGICPTCPDPDIQVLLSCATPEYPSGPRCMESVKELAEAEGLKAVYLDKSGETLTNIKDYLTCPQLIMWARVGHGSRSGIVLGSGSFNTSAVNSLEGNKLKNIRLHFNSCDCHTGTFEQAILDADAYFYCGGDISLAVGRSEDVTLRFMEKIITDQKEVEPSLTAAMDEIGYRNSFGISGCDEKPWLWWPNLDPYIKVSSPAGGEKWEQGTTQNIRWSDNIDGNVTIELYKGGSLKETLAASTESDGTFEWQIAGNYEAGDDYKLKIGSVDSTALFDESDSNFSIITEYIIVCPYFQNFDTLEAKSEILPFKYMQLEDDDLNWTVYTGPTPSRIDDPPDVTGPEADHTTGQQGNYIYTEASASNSGNPNKKFDFTTPKFNFSSLKNPLLSFWYHMFSDNAGEDHMGELHLDISVDGVWNNDVITAIDGNQGDAWHEQTLDLNPYRGERVILRFRGITGDSWESDISLDDIKIFEDPTGIGDTGPGAPSSYGLHYYGSRLHYSIPENKNQISINLYNLQGKLVKTLVNSNINSGYHSIPLHNFATGLYLVKLEAEDYSKTITVMITR